MKTLAAFATTAGACAFVAVTLAAPASAGDHKDGIHRNGPVLDGQQVALPVGTANQEVAFGDPGITVNGPALDGHKVVLPDGPAQARR